VAGFLLDAQIVAWSALSPERIKSAAQDILTSSAPLLVSSASIAELSIKLSIGKLKLPGTPVELCALLGAKELPVSWDHAQSLTLLPMLHRDPFDRLLIAQAMAEGLTLITSDAAIMQYPDVELMAG
jgi:PIN domain nuclease of toxin-antitoxin system